MGTLCPSPRVTAPRGEGTVPGARSLCALASARCCLGIFKGEGLSLGRGRGRCAPSGAPTLSFNQPVLLVEKLRPYSGGILAQIHSDPEVTIETWVV